MRLWHTDLIKVLPRQQLLAQWRELCSIYANENRHILINFVYEDLESLRIYSELVKSEMASRGYKLSENSLSKEKTFFEKYNVELVDKEVFPDKMNIRYFKQCYYNIEEKYDCGGLTVDEFEKIYSLGREHFKKVDTNTQKCDIIVV